VLTIEAVGIVATQMIIWKKASFFGREAPRSFVLACIVGRLSPILAQLLGGTKK
jgi:hypothetical protein